MRSYLRISPTAAEDKLADGYTATQLAGWFLLLTLAEQQANRGRFKNLALLKASLGQFSRCIPFFLAQKDLELLPDGRYYVVGWDEWQEGNWQVAERMRRVREAQNDRNGCDAPDRNEGDTDDRNASLARRGGKRIAVSGKHSAASAGAREEPRAVDRLEDDLDPAAEERRQTAVRVIEWFVQKRGYPQGAPPNGRMKALASEADYIAALPIPPDRLIYELERLWETTSPEDRPNSLRWFYTYGDLEGVADRVVKQPKPTGRDHALSRLELGSISL